MALIEHFLPESVNENCMERVYKWNINMKELCAVSRQLPGAKESELEISYAGMDEGIYIVKWGVNALLNNSQVFKFENGMKLLIKGLETRGKKYYFRIYKKVNENEIPVIPTLCFRTIIRYPYGRTFQDNFKHLTQRFGQDTVVKYDLKYYSNDDSLDEVKIYLGDTSISGYLDHIILTIIKPDMTCMQKAIGIAKFIGQAIHHNPVHINLKETVRAMDEFVEKGWEKADIDKESVWLMELGHTRCGVINGFLSCSLLRKIGVPNEVYHGCGGHTTGKAFIDGKWRLWDVDAYKGVLPLDPWGNLPANDWLKQDGNIFLLDTIPSWNDSKPDEGWLLTNKGTRMTGYTGGGRYHSETGYGSYFNGGIKEYPPGVPVTLPVRKKSGDNVLLEWIGSYDRDGDFRDYLVEIIDAENGNIVLQFNTVNTYINVKLPSIDIKYKFSVKARDFHAKGTPYEDKIDYTSSVPMEIPMGNFSFENHNWSLAEIDDLKGRVSLISSGDVYDFIRTEGFDDVLGQVNYCKTELWKLKAGEHGKSIYRLIDETNYWFNGCLIRSLWKRKLENVRKNTDGWHFTSVLSIEKKDMAGKSKFPVLWIGREQSHLGFGLIVDPDDGLVFTGSNIFGDWRCGKGFEPFGWFRLDIINIPGKKTVNYYINGELLYAVDTNAEREEVFDVDAVYISSNPEAEFDFMIAEIIV